MRTQDCGAFFGSIHATLDHIVWGDTIWLSRFTKGTTLECAAPDYASGTVGFPDWAKLRAARIALDADILAWSAQINAHWLAQDMSWQSATSNATNCKPHWLLVTHFFNHQTHHRGQVSTLLNQVGVDIGVTDLPWMPV